MNQKELKIYIEGIRKKIKTPIPEQVLEKDYVLSSFLSNWEKLKAPSMDKLIFKGGTLLTKNYLKYHRISEDLDFTHQDADEIRKMQTEGKMETQIKRRITSVIRDVKKNC